MPLLLLAHSEVLASNGWVLVPPVCHSMGYVSVSHINKLGCVRVCVRIHWWIQSQSLCSSSTQNAGPDNGALIFIMQSESYCMLLVSILPLGACASHETLTNLG